MPEVTRPHSFTPLESVLREMPKCWAKVVTLISKGSKCCALMIMPGCEGRRGMSRLAYHLAHNPIPLMAILIIHDIGVAILKTECPPPVSGDLHRPYPFKLTFERVTVIPGKIHISYVSGVVQAATPARWPARVFRLPFGSAFIVKTFKPFMCKALYHSYPLL